MHNCTQSLHSILENHLKVQDYMIGEVIGQGSFGQIRIAFHNRSRIPFAVKIISKSQLMQSRNAKQIFFNETVLAPLVDHPSIIKIVEIVDSPSQIFQFMRLAENGDLLRLLRSSPLEQKFAMRTIDQILSAVEYLHANGIVHRDIKLENILMSKRTGAKLCDFGLSTITFDGKVTGNCGSIEYAAPEAIDQPVYDGFKADMWSVGVVIYAIFTRKLPFQNNTNTPTYFERYNYDSQIDMTFVPKNMQPLILKLLSIDPNERPSATEARSFPPLSSLSTTQLHKKDPLSMLQPFDLSITESNFTIISKLSQVLHVPHQTVITRLRETTMNRPKLLYNLLLKTSQNINFDFNAHERKGNTYCLMTSNTSASTLNSIQKSPSLISSNINSNTNSTISNDNTANNKDNSDSSLDNFNENIKNSDSETKESDLNSNKELSRVFKANAFTIYDTMHSFLMKNKACMSSPISSAPMIMMKQESGTDIKLFFACKDQNPNEISAILKLYPEPSSMDLSVRIMEYMEKYFLDHPIES